MQTKAQQYIEFNQDFQKIAVVKKNQTGLQPTPMKGIRRLILERRGDEVARRGTSVVQYDPGSSFNSHIHHYGEQFYVLQGVFSDHTGDFSKGWYVRNPIKSAHAPFSKQGTKIFVKLAQMPIDQSQQLKLDTNQLDFEQIKEGLSRLTLYESKYQQVFLYKLSKESQLPQKNNDSTQIFVIEGQIHVLGQKLQKQSWMRVPANEQFVIKANEQTKLYIKVGKGVVRDKQWNQIKYDNV